jgi:alkylation response protein AidB-like acyl-CoA dehydrogenase
MTGTRLDELAPIRDEAQRLLRDNVNIERLEALLDTQGAFDYVLWQLVVEQGWPAAGVTENDDGLGLGLAGVALLAEELGRHTVALPLAASALIATILYEHTSPQTTDQAAGLRDGRLTGCLVLGQLTNGSLGGESAIRVDANAKASGCVAGVPFGATADLALCTASHDGVSALILVPLNAPGVKRELLRTIDDARAYADLHFESVSAHVVATGVACDRARDYAATLSAFEQLGGAQAALALAIDYANQREAFGQPISKFQAIKHKLVDIYSAIEIARGCALSALKAIDGTPLEKTDTPAAEAAAAARLAAIEAYELAARDCINIFGGLGVTREAAPHRHYRRARALALDLGSKALWRDHLIDLILTRTIQGVHTNA